MKLQNPTPNPSPMGRGTNFGSSSPQRGEARRGAFFLLLLIGAQVFLAAPAITEFSPTYDEPVHLAAGAVYWKTGDYRLNGYHHPPFGEMWAAIPLIFMDVFVPKQHPAWISQRWNPYDQYGFADVFLYKNRTDAEKMMSAGRAMQLVMSCLLGAAIFIAAFSLAGLPAGCLAGGLWALSPTFLANGTIVSTDLAFTFFFFGFFACLLRFGDWRFDVGAGACLGLAFASKYFSLSILPIVSLLLLLDSRLRKPKSWLIVAAAAGISLAAAYRFSNLDVFWDGLTAIFSRSQAGRSSFFNGQYGTQGWLLYFPFVFVVKTPLPVLLSIVGAVAAIIREKRRVPLVMWLPPVLFFAVACTSKVQIGHRHIMAVYPFLFVLVAVGMTLWPRRAQRSIGAILLGWSLLTALLSRPHHLAYFNEIIGGPANGYKHLTDSNVDWGQGLRPLAEALTEEDKREGIFLSYFGVADPHFYGIRYLDIGSDRIVPRIDDTALGLRPRKLAISVTNLQGTYYADHAAFAWLKEYEPSKKIAHSIFLYDFSDKPDALSHLEKLRP